ncbi:MAG TPA: flagellin [Deltaproteobacteria bacterium]|nr:flagellin [Deltaproteobacteria bacterium]
MGLRIQNNIEALNAHKNLTISSNSLAKSLERLSSGYRINRASDDAAGLSISQQFRADIASYKVCSRNVSEANSLLQVAEGALDNIGNMLTRLKELATQASSANAGSNLGKIDAEAQKLIDEIERIATSTEYAGSALIDGSFGVTVAATSGIDIGVNGFAGISGMQAGATYTFTIAAGSDADHFDLTLADADGNSQFLNEVEVPAVGITKDVYFSSLGITISVTSDLAADTGTVTGSATGNASFQVGSENQSDNRIDISLGNAKSSVLGTLYGGANTIDSIDLSNATDAQTALTTINDAISDLASIRGDIGAAQNRLSYSAANLATTIENVTAAESVIRDVDMAAEMTSFTKNQILMQAGTAMLAQANMAPQSVLSLFG